MSSHWDYDAIIVGGGLSGMAAAIRWKLDLKSDRMLIIEREPEFGGTWQVNSYPSAGCDIPTKLYSFSFYQKKQWSEFYSKQPEISAYIRETARHFDLYSCTALQHEGKLAKWDDSKKIWHVTYQSVKGDAAPITKTCKVLISGMGLLSIPRECNVPGAKDFEGPLFHTARWDHSVDCTNKNVVVIGNGCSGTQCVPGLAPKVKHITQIVKQRHWYSPQPRPPPFFSRTLGRYLPGWVAFERALVAFSAESHFIQADKKYGKGARQRYADTCYKYITEYSPEKYHHLLIPDPEKVPVACKRRIFDESTREGYITCLNRDNVEITETMASKITKDAVVLEDGRVLPADVIVYAGGFEVGNAFNLQMRVEGPNGITLDKYWKQTKAPQAYRSCMLSAFPNLFILAGPNAGIGHFSALHVSECIAELITTASIPLFAPEAKPTATVQVKREAEDKEQRWIQDSMDHKIYSSNCGAWYQDKSGRVTAIAPCPQFTFSIRARYPMLRTDFNYANIGNVSPIKHLSYWKQLSILLRRGEIWDPANKTLYDRVIRLPLYAAFMRVWQLVSWLLDTFVVHWSWPVNPKNQKAALVNGHAKHD